MQQFYLFGFSFIFIAFFGIANGQFSPTPSTQIDTSTCGVSKGCFRVPDGCSFTNCDYLLTYKANGNDIDFELSSKVISGTTAPYVAIGFSSDAKMGDDSVLACLSMASSNQMKIYQSYNRRYVNVAISQAGLQPTKTGVVENGRITCTFSRQKTVAPPNAEIFDLAQKWHLLIARGTESAGALTKHSTSAGHLPVISSGDVDLSSVDPPKTSNKEESPEHMMKRAHAIFMILAWTLPSGLAILIARFYKEDFSVMCIKSKLWFQLHRISMVVVLVFTILGFILIFVAEGGFEMDSELPNAAHPILGIIVTVLCIANPIMALFRPDPTHEKRPIFNWSHRIVGGLSYLLANITIIIGFLMGEFKIPSWTVWLMGVYMIIYGIIFIALEVCNCIATKKHKVDTEMKTISDDDKSNEAVAEEVDKGSSSSVVAILKKVLIAVYIVVAAILLITMIVYIAMG
ncbi:putative ferric-chelate reductase 1 homolog [Tubulanus polymorphus]|uniref:putative ferric-chelate reductase 1 homolog n=1 Tax=Tubulanus polymorphus TaxID=672921 RepID=UPI003DA6CE1E